QASDCRSEIACAPGGGRGHDSRLLVEFYDSLLRRRRVCRKQRISDGPGGSLMTRGDLYPVTAPLTFENTRSPLGDDSPGLHDRDSTRQTVGLLEILRGQQHRCTSGGDLPHRVPHVGASPWIQARRRFIEEEDDGVEDHTHRDVEAPAHPARVRAHRTVCRLGEGELAEELVGSSLGVPAREAEQPAEHHEILTSAEDLVERGGLADETDATADLSCLSTDVEAGDLGCSTSEADVCTQHIGHARFACAVGAQEAVDGPCRNLHRQLVEGSEISVVLDQTRRSHRRAVTVVVPFFMHSQCLTIYSVRNWVE